MKEKATRILLLTCLAVLVSLSALAAGDEVRKEGDYIIGPGDVLVISVWKDEALTREVTVLPDGTVSFPLIGTCTAEGRTVDELKNDIAKKVSKYVPDPVLSVSVKTVSSMFVYVIGRVNNPGRFVLNSNVNVLQALAMAGGLTPFAVNNGIKIMRTVDGTSTSMSFRYNDVVKGEHLEQNIILKRGDVIVVP